MVFNSKTLFTLSGGIVAFLTADKFLQWENISVNARKIDSNIQLEISRLNNDTAVRNERTQRMKNNQAIRDMVNKTYKTYK